MRDGWLSIRNQGEAKAEIIVDGFIGDSWDDNSKTYSNGFRNALASIPEGAAVTIGLNSPGGAIDDGLAIFNAIKDRGNVTVRVDGYALSIASLILQAGAVRIVPDSALVMEHDPWSGAVGNSRDMRKNADILDKHRDVIADVMAGRSRRRREDVLRAMEEETWYTGAEAVAAGIADQSTSDATQFKQFDASKFRKVPKALAAYAVDKISAVVPQEKPANQAEANQTKKEDMKALMALLATAGIVASAEANDEQAVASAKAWLDKQNADTDAVKASLETERKEHAETRKAFAEAAVDRAVSEGKIEDKPETRAAWSKAHIADRATAGVQMASIKAAPAAQMGHTMGQGSGEKKPKELFGLERTIAAMAAGRRN
jgi:ATP-dependent protease ClpP protease subunit